MTPFQTYVRDCGRTQRALADTLEISRPHLSLLISGKKRPSLDLAIRIEQLTEGAVPATSWAPTPHTEDEAA